MKKFFEFIGFGISTPIVYALFSIAIILSTFLVGLPIGIGIHLIQMAINWIFI
jgi:hypothetical protein